MKPRPNQGRLTGVDLKRLVRQVLVPCPCCGNGTATLDEVNSALAGTLVLLAQQTEPISTIALHAIRHPSNDYVTETGMCNRLARLEAYGLAKHERRGKAKYWTATLPNTAVTECGNKRPPAVTPPESGAR